MTVINTYDKPAGEVRFGNYVFGEKVLSTKPARVNTVITLEKPVDNKTVWTFRLTDMLEVGVEELTEEEKAARKLEHKRESERHFVREVKSWAKSATNALAEFEKTRAKRLADGWGMLDYSTIQTQLEVASRYDLAREINAIFASAADGTFHHHPGQECDYTERTDSGRRCVIASSYTDLDVAKQIVHRQQHFLTNRVMRMRTLSRSTSVISNLCEDMQMQAAVDFLTSLRYASYGVDGITIEG